jgi:hypothetical protein
MKFYRRLVGALTLGSLLLATSGCAHRGAKFTATRLVGTPETGAGAEAQARLLSASAALLGAGADGASVATTVELGSLDSLTEPAGRRADGLDLFVLGGLLIPGQLSLDEFTFSEHTLTERGYVMKVETSSRYVAIPPVCQSALARLEMEEGVATLSFENFYCN